MKLTKPLVGVGSSLGFIIDKPIRDKMNLKKGDLIEVNFNKVKATEYFCYFDNYYFLSAERKNVICPICGNSNTIKELKGGG